MTSHIHSPALDPRWPFPVATILLYAMILLPSVAILTMYAPIMASMVSGGLYREERFADPFVFTLVLNLILGVSILTHYLDVVLSFFPQYLPCISYVLLVQ
ncbi:hypothetical protein EV426DRAFT_581538 [Tirmania nivea]|nr:hypothetical protein EV426DRAFT_581538 [Tirmania nivea]